MKKLLYGCVFAFLVFAAPLSADDSKDKWADDVPYLTDWEDAIKQARETGKMLFIYNGWKKNV